MYVKSPKCWKVLMPMNRKNFHSSSIKNISHPDKIPYGRQWIDDKDIAAVVKVLKTDWLTQGPSVAIFEKELANYVGTKYAVAVSSGTAASHLACLVAGIAPGEEVIVPTLSFVA